MVYTVTVGHIQVVTIMGITLRVHLLHFTLLTCDRSIARSHQTSIFDCIIRALANVINNIQMRLIWPCTKMPCFSGGSCPISHSFRYRGLLDDTWIAPLALESTASYHMSAWTTHALSVSYTLFRYRARQTWYCVYMSKSLYAQRQHYCNKNAAVIYAVTLHSSKLQTPRVQKA